MTASLLPVLLAAAVGLLSAGCAAVKERSRLGYAVGSADVVRPARVGGLYEVKWSATPDGPRQPVPHTKRVLFAGDPVGFAPADGGGVVAVAGPERFPLRRLPPDARYCTWVSQSPKPQAGPLAAVGDAVRRTVREGPAAAAAVLGGVAVAAFDAWADDDCDDSDVRAARSHSGRHRGGPDPAAPEPKTGPGYVPWASPPIVR